MPIPYNIPVVKPTPAPVKPSLSTPSNTTSSKPQSQTVVKNKEPIKPPVVDEKPKSRADALKVPTVRKIKDIKIIPTPAKKDTIKK